jgi:hypothetical protein
VTYAGAKWVGRFPCMWIPTVLYREELREGEEPRFRSGAELSPVERWFRSTVVSDAIEGSPDVVLVGVPASGGPGPEDYRIDLLRYFSADLRFAKLMSQYVRVGEAVGYTIYRRGPQAPT